MAGLLNELSFSGKPRLEPPHSKQFRISERVDIIDESNPNTVQLQQREKSWFASSLRSTMQYLGPHPGLPCLTEQPLNDAKLDTSSSPVAAICLLVLDPDQVDYLNLKSNQRIMYTVKHSAAGEKQWNSERITP